MGRRYSPTCAAAVVVGSIEKWSCTVECIWGLATALHVLQRRWKVVENLQSGAGGVLGQERQSCICAVSLVHNDEGSAKVAKIRYY